MSTGQAVTMPEGSFPDLTKPQLVFGGNDISASQSIGESSTTDVPEIEAKENSCVAQNHIGKEVCKFLLFFSSPFMLCLSLFKWGAGP